MSSNCKYYPPHHSAILAKKVTGRVKWFNVNLGYGFIHRDDNDEDIFAHQTNINKNVDTEQPILNEDEDVEFNVIKTKKGFKAIDIIRLKNVSSKAKLFTANNPCDLNSRTSLKINDNLSSNENDNIYLKNKSDLNKCNNNVISFKSISEQSNLNTVTINTMASHNILPKNSFERLKTAHPNEYENGRKSKTGSGTQKSNEMCLIL